ncbi:rhomboid family intramembrane serine protease [Cyclobacteriaceae bacterium]|nr:rhomboid family intramembrane serine protease [Cyclobacteriaceae bacterium]
MHPAARSSVLRPFRLLMLMWLFFSVSFFFNIDFGFLGILPRSYFGLIGIFTGPLVHGNLHHISSNSVPVLFLGTILYFFYPKIANRIFLQCYFFTNILVWFFGRTFLHIGASGLIYALAFFLISIGFFEGKFRALIISIAVLAVYGSLIYTAFDFNQAVSWESHLFGALVGVTSAYSIKKYGHLA